jgi:phospholipid/cholesterol/gamma-HCH transport system substrate-binding protein
MSTRSQNIRTGLFVGAAFIALASLIILFGQSPNFYKDARIYYITFSDAPGVAPGAPVRRSGVKVGEVRSLKLDSETGNVKVAIALDPEFTPRTSEEPTIVRGLLVNDTSIDFLPKMPENPNRGDFIAAGAELQGVSPFNARALITQATDVIPEARESLNQIRMSLRRFEMIAPKIESTLDEYTLLAKSARESLPKLEATADEIRVTVAGAKDIGPKASKAIDEIRVTIEGTKDLGPKASKAIDEIRFFVQNTGKWVEQTGILIKENEPRLAKAIDQVTATGDSIQKTFSDENRKAVTELVANIRDTTQVLPEVVKQFGATADEAKKVAELANKEGKVTFTKLNNTLDEGRSMFSELRIATQPIAEKSPKVMQNLESASDQASRAMVEIREILRNFAQGQGTLQKLMTDETLYNNANSIASSLTRILPRFDRILQDLEVFADKIARHPESIGVRGAINPGAGLKESPNATLPRSSNRP